MDLDRSHLHIAAFLNSFGSRPFQSLDSLGNLFRRYLPLVSSHIYSTHQLPFSTTTPVLLAVDALAYCHFGRANADPASVRRSFDAYGIAVQSMSATLARMEYATVSFGSMSEEDWGHVAFFCLVMAFWEV